MGEEGKTLGNGIRLSSEYLQQAKWMTVVFGKPYLPYSECFLSSGKANKLMELSSASVR